MTHIEKWWLSGSVVHSTRLDSASSTRMLGTLKVHCVKNSNKRVRKGTKFLYFV